MKHKKEHMHHKHADGMHHSHAHGQYENEVEKPHVPMEGHMLHGMGCHEFKGEADPIAYGQASGPGCKSDNTKIMSQMKMYHWD